MLDVSPWNQFIRLQEQGRLGHALLIQGALKSNKQEIINKISSSLLCEKPNQDFTPCERCQSCQKIKYASHPELIQIALLDDKQIITIDQIRAISQQFYHSSLHEKRVILIEDCDKLQLNAAHALLKILEEPPASTYFIMTATQIAPILPTILSRCYLMTLADSAQVDDGLNLALNDYVTSPGKAKLNKLLNSYSLQNILTHVQIVYCHRLQSQPHQVSMGSFEHYDELIKAKAALSQGVAINKDLVIDCVAIIWQSLLNQS